MKELSIFVDESGDFGKLEETCPYYIVTFVLHDQTKDIKTQVDKLNISLSEIGLTNHTIHTGPLIRREKCYLDFLLKDRQKIFNKLFHFSRNTDIKYKSFVVEKRNCKNQFDINSTLSKQFAEFIRDNLSFFNEFHTIILYYDNGQRSLTNILITVFSTFFTDNFEYRDAFHNNYKLFQTADLICTMSLIEYKLKDHKKLTKSELIFFSSDKKFKKNYLKQISKKAF